MPPLVPVVALSFALVAAELGKYLSYRLGRRSLQACAGVILVAVLAIGVKDRARALALPSLNPGGAAGVDPERRIKEYEEIGNLVHHTTRALMLDWGLGGLWYYGRIAGRYWPNHWDLDWEERTRLGVGRMSAYERFVTTNKRYLPAVGTIQPPPSVFIVLEPIELALEPDLSALLSGFRVIAESPDYVIFDLTHRATTGHPWTQTQPVSASTESPNTFLHHLPPSWRAIKPQMTREKVLRALGPPHRIVVRSELKKVVECWFYGQGNQYAIVFIDGKMFVKAGSY